MIAAAADDDAAAPVDASTAEDASAPEDAPTLDRVPASADVAGDAAPPDVIADVAPAPEDVAPEDAEDTDIPASGVPSAYAWRRCFSRGCDDPVAVAVGGGHSCARRASGSVYCRGNNQAGQLGDGSFLGAVVPVYARGLIGVVERSTGGSNGCVRHASGTLSC